MMNIEALNQAGIDYHRGVTRFMEDAVLYESMLTAYLDEDTYARMESAFAAGDYRQAFACVHELKGLSSNLDMVDLNAACRTLTELLRENDSPDLQAAGEGLSAVRAADQRVRDGIRQASR